MRRPKIVPALPPSSPGRPVRLPRSVARMGVLPSVVFPDSWVNLHNAGSLFSIMPENGYVDILAGATEFARFENGGPYVHTAISGVACVQDLTDDDIDNDADWECHWSRTTGQIPMALRSWIHGLHLFGVGQYPNYFAMPLVIEAGEDLILEVRNNTANTLRIYLELRCRRVYRDAVNGEV